MTTSTASEERQARINDLADGYRILLQGDDFSTEMDILLGVSELGNVLDKYEIEEDENAKDALSDHIGIQAAALRSLEDEELLDLISMLARAEYDHRDGWAFEIGEPSNDHNGIGIVAKRNLSNQLAIDKYLLHAGRLAHPDKDISYQLTYAFARASVIAQLAEQAHEKPEIASYFEKLSDEKVNITLRDIQEKVREMVKESDAARKSDYVPPAPDLGMLSRIILGTLQLADGEWFSRRQLALALMRPGNLSSHDLRVLSELEAAELIEVRKNEIGTVKFEYQYRVKQQQDA